MPHPRYSYRARIYGIRYQKSGLLISLSHPAPQNNYFEIRLTGSKDWYWETLGLGDLTSAKLSSYLSRYFNEISFEHEWSNQSNEHCSTFITMNIDSCLLFFILCKPQVLFLHFANFQSWRQVLYWWAVFLDLS